MHTTTNTNMEYNNNDKTTNNKHKTDDHMNDNIDDAKIMRGRRIIIRIINKIRLTIITQITIITRRNT